MTPAEQHPTDDFVELRRILATILRGWWLLLLIPLLAAAGAYWLTRQQPRVYQAATSVIVGRSIQSTNLDTRDIETSQQLALTYADIARRQPVLQAAIDTLGLQATWRELKERVFVNQVDGTQLLEITVEAGNPEEARRIADEIANELILLSPTTLQNAESEASRRFVRERLDNLEARIALSQASLDEIESTMTTADSSAEVRQLQEDFMTQQTLLANLEANYAQLLAFTNGEDTTNHLAIVEPAQANSSPVRPRLQLNLLVAVLVGLVVAVGLILVLDYMDDRVRSLDELRYLFGLVPLGVVGRISRHQREPVAAHDLYSPVAESFRMIRSSVHLQSPGTSTKQGTIVTVTSATPQEGKSLVAANLGVVMAQAGFRTVIVDADLRRSRQHQIFQIANNKGLTTALVTSNPHLISTTVDRLSLFPAGPPVPNPSEILSTRRMDQLLTRLTNTFEVVIIDSTPLLASAEAVMLSNKADGVILVCRANRTQKEDLKEALYILQQAHTTVWGAVLNDVRNGSRHTYTAPRVGAAERNPAPRRALVKLWDRISRSQ